MNPAHCKALIAKRMAEHGLIEAGWRFRYCTWKRPLARCCYDDKMLEFSIHYVELNGQDLVEDTILHEIAHALAPHAGHGPEWMRVAEEIGARPVPCKSADEVEVTERIMYWEYVCFVCDARMGPFDKRPEKTAMRCKCGGRMVRKTLTDAEAQARNALKRIRGRNLETDASGESARAYTISPSAELLLNRARQRAMAKIAEAQLLLSKLNDYRLEIIEIGKEANISGERVDDSARRALLARLPEELRALGEMSALDWVEQIIPEGASQNREGVKEDSR